MKEYIVEILEVWKQKIRGEDSCPCHLRSPIGGLKVVTGPGKGKVDPRETEGGLNVSLNMCMYGSAHKSEYITRAAN